MERLILEIIDELRRTGNVDDRSLDSLIRRHNRDILRNEDHHSKRRLLAYCLRVRQDDPERWASWGMDASLERQLLQVLQMKPRRTASGVATITVITKPWTCSSDCLYCPNDVRMPKSYLSDEPACQRAERNYFDPYLQVTSRLRALTQMGHVTDKVELIVLGGTWSDYPDAYQIWFISELFRALNDGDAAEEKASTRRDLYRSRGFSNRPEELAEQVADVQAQVDSGTLTYNRAWTRLYGEGSAWGELADGQTATLAQLTHEHRVNETAAHRVVGLVVETRPDLIDAKSLTMMRRLGCTKVQVGIQSLDPGVLSMNERHITLERIRSAFEWLRVFGYKIHVHTMVNLYGSSPTADKRDYQLLVTEPAYLPDEVKLYPCVLVQSAHLKDRYADGSWDGYRDEELVDILVTDTLATPPYMRISRMIRDISAEDILAGNKVGNLRQMVQERIEQMGVTVSEIRYREINDRAVDADTLKLEVLEYETSNTEERFLQWVTPQNRIAGFLRLSLPRKSYIEEHVRELPVHEGEAMIREVHVYGAAARLHRTGKGVQHLGLGRGLIARACEIARGQGYDRLNVISSVGTRGYYRSLGFADGELYQYIDLTDDFGRLSEKMT